MDDEVAARIRLEIETGLNECKCAKCSCMLLALESASKHMDTVEFYKQMRQPERDCFECDPCYGANASNLAHKLRDGALKGTPSP